MEIEVFFALPLATSYIQTDVIFGLCRLQYDSWSSLLLSYFVTVPFSIAFFFCVSLHKCTLYFTMQRMTTPVERRYVCEGKPLALQKLILCLITMESYRTPLKSESFVVFLRQFITTKATAPKEAKVLTKESHIRKRLSLYLQFSHWVSQDTYFQSNQEFHFRWN